MDAYPLDRILLFGFLPNCMDTSNCAVPSFRRHSSACFCSSATVCFRRM